MRIPARKGRWQNKFKKIAALLTSLLFCFMLTTGLVLLELTLTEMLFDI